MLFLKGKGVFGGIAIGTVYFYERKESQVKRQRVEDPQAEMKRFEEAKTQALDNLEKLYQDAVEKVGEENAQIFKIHQMMLEDEDYYSSIHDIITNESMAAEYAVAQTEEHFYEMFSTMDDDYMKERAADVKDISERVINILTHTESSGLVADKPVIVAADDLAPSETIKMDRSKILGLITEKGSSNSHTAILARNMNIPAVVNIDGKLKSEYHGKQAIVDGSTGEIYIEPDEKTTTAYLKKRAREEERLALLNKLKGKENLTLDGKRIDIFANIGEPGDVPNVLKNDAGGIGLFRSEFLYLGSKTYPTEDEQFESYKSVAESMSGKKVIIRTLDIGADKQVDYFEMPQEENPAMGCRAIRICLTRPDIFKTQLRALLRASAFGRIAIMFPMITSVGEIRKIKEIVNAVKQELTGEGVDFDQNIELGIMIETPAAALVSDDLAKEVDFFSVGTNDLSQYTLAIDRQNQSLEAFYNPHHKAILRLIKMAADSAHRNGIMIGICGELGADLALTETFLNMGIDELSVSPSSVLPLRNKVRQTRVSEVSEKSLSALE